ncbi:polysaccharide deacetylase family protein [Nocardia stercoris]|uniref:Polysaccharide deacetylase family protein n=1 Tax=Nocardia stercoris TaxID=2483361 RepID=A0A3M2L8Q3_9NOCA|nr:polysaccharide deacetylase family protein [Nocardia stercoris]RMI33991.1 polysaccharide deacetylase family protein [Nocardia stercoris]
MLNRRQWLTMLAAGTVAAVSGCGTKQPTSPDATIAPPVPVAAAHPPLLLPPPRGPKAVLPPGTITALPGEGNALALTVDDGADSSVVAAYIQFAKDTGARFTFFVTASYDSWTDNAAALRPLVESGQIQLGNHTWDHPALTKLSATGVADQLGRTKTFLRNTFGVDGTPFFRPPYGFHNATVDRIAADLGYTVPTMWYGSFGDSSVVTEDYLVDQARAYFNPQALVIGHANHPPVTHCYDRLVAIIRERNLAMVTLNDVLTPLPA